MPRVSRRRVLSTLVGGLAAAAGCGGDGPVAKVKQAIGKAKPPKATGPNLILLFTDQERFFGELPEGLALPGHAKLARLGTRFVNHYTSAVMCTPSRSVMLTGLQTADNGMFDNTDVPFQDDLSRRIDTVGDRLRKAGYYTAYKGKWHLTGSFHPHEGEPRRPGQFEGEMDRKYGFSDFSSPGDVIGSQLGGHQNDHLVAANAVQWLRTKGKQLQAEGQPWALVISLVNPHDVMYFDTDAPGERVQNTGHLLMEPARAPDHAAYQTTYQHPLPASRSQPVNAPGRPAAHREYDRAWGHILGRIPPEEARWRRLQDFYFNSLRSVDAHVLTIVDELEALGLRDGTALVYTSDHGEMAGAHGLRGKGPFGYEENLHLPMYVIHPDVEGGRDCKALSSHIDLVPTLLSLAGAVDQAHELPGRDLSPALTDPAKARLHHVRDSILFTYSGLIANDANLFDLLARKKSGDAGALELLRGFSPDVGKRGNVRTVFDGRHKLSRYFAPRQRNRPRTLDQLFADNDVELFDLEQDPAEMKNLAAGERTPEVDGLLSAMNEKLDRVMQAEYGEDDGRELPRSINAAAWLLRTVDL
jgi:arylsulfatase